LGRATILEIYYLKRKECRMLTKREALTKTIEVWEILAVSPDGTEKGEVFTSLGIKLEDRPEFECYLCEYQRQLPYCDLCIELKIWGTSSCWSIGNPYDKWFFCMENNGGKGSQAAAKEVLKALKQALKRLDKMEVSNEI
jgi:hypothetical protein